MFKAVKMLNRQKASNPIVSGKDRKSLRNTQDIHKEMKRHFGQHFCNKNYQNKDSFEGDRRPFNLTVSLEEIGIVMQKLNNNRAPRLDQIATELVRYVPVELRKVIKSILNECFEEHKHIEVVKSALFSIQNLVKPRGLLKNLLQMILLQVIRKIPSNVAIRRMKDRYEEYISPIQSTYIQFHSTSDIVWTHRRVAVKIQKLDTEGYLTGIDMSSAFYIEHLQHNQIGF